MTPVTSQSNLFLPCSCHAYFDSIANVYSSVVVAAAAAVVVVVVVSTVAVVVWKSIFSSTDIQ
jgi:uncharacterized membrane protein YhfC